MTISPTILFPSVLAALLPTLLYVALVYWIDRYEKEPWWLLAATFLWGALPSVLLAYLFNSVLSLPVYLLAGDGLADTITATLIAPPVEETVKGIALLFLLLRWRHEIDSPLDGIIYGAMVGMGFGMVENVFYFVNTYADAGREAWQLNVFARGVLFGLNHALFSSVTGLGIAVARMSPHRAVRLLTPLAGWAGAVFLHFLHNVTVSLNDALWLLALLFDWGGVALTLLIALWALVQERRWMRQYLAAEVAQGVLTVSQYEIACSGRRRTRHRWRTLLSHGPGAYRLLSRYYARCSELAYKKHHHALFRDEATARLIGELRSELLTLGPRLR